MQCKLHAVVATVLYTYVAMVLCTYVSMIMIFCTYVAMVLCTYVAMMLGDFSFMSSLTLENKSIGGSRGYFPSDMRSVSAS